VMCAVTVVLAGLTDAAWAVAAGLGRAWSARPAVRRRADRRRPVAVAGKAGEL